jgi:hypothetical protein
MEYVWFIWSLIILCIWAVIYWFRKDNRKEMLKMSLITMPFGLTEPLFVPEYWNPPSLFSLAQRTGFDVESLIFSFAIGGIGTVLYLLIFNRKYIEISKVERHQHRHKWHIFILNIPIVIFFILAIFTGLNHIYCAVIALFIGALATNYCRPDLKSKIWIGGILFTLLYVAYFDSILIFYPNYVTEYWNLKSLSHILILGIPLEELLFSFTFGMYWSSLYEHVYWRKLINSSNE